jgi:hypothetical protein
MHAAVATWAGSQDAANEDWAGVLAPGLAVVLDGLSAPDGDRHRLSPRHALIHRPARPTTADPGKRPHPAAWSARWPRRSGRLPACPGLRPDHPGTPSAAVTGSLAGKDLHRAVLLSDGASRLVDLFELATWEELLALLDASGPDELLRQVRAAEAVDPQGRQWPRTKRSDDATASTWSSTRPRASNPEQAAWDGPGRPSQVGASFSHAPRVEGPGRAVLACPTPAASPPPTNSAPGPAHSRPGHAWPTSLAPPLALAALACHGVHRPPGPRAGQPARPASPRRAAP